MIKQKPATTDAFKIISASIHDAALVLKAMSSDTRLKILCALNKGELPVSQLAEMTGQSSSAVSQHLTKLRAAGLVQSRRQAQMIYYSSTAGVGKEIVETLCKFYEK
jgi:ArsR family transcriptional regulator, virulence genes transcriptional regulator